MLGGGVPVQAAVPTYVVEFELNTKFERSLERFLFDLFNTLQRREEDFTAAFELQKIEKAREDTAKLFQEVESELVDYGLAYEAYDERLTHENNPDDAPLLISPIKDNRIISDPIAYLSDEPIEYGRLVFACRMNYFIWDQMGVPDIYGDTTGLPAPNVGSIAGLLTEIEADDEKFTYINDLDGNGSNQENIDGLVNSKKLGLINFRTNDWPFYQQSDGSGDLQDDDPALSNFLNHNNVTDVLPLCESVMELYRISTPADILRNVLYATWDIDFPDPETANKTRARIIRERASLPSLRAAIADDFALYEDLDALFLGGDQNRLSGALGIAEREAVAVINNVRGLHKMNYEIGQGIRPENLYVTLSDNYFGGVSIQEQIYLNTEYVVSPAVVLLQKMQAATQATFDLAGQGFLYLDAESTPNEILGRYNLASTRNNNEERRICNNAGACQLLDAWLKPAASFRSVATLDSNQPTPQVIGPGPERLNDSIGGGTEATIAGSGLPAPWEDESPYVFITPERTHTANPAIQRRYTVSRFRNSLGGQDDLLGGNNPLARLLPDNIGNKYTGSDFPINDYFDRVFEMYESNIFRDIGAGRSRGIFGLDDWECSIALWFREKKPGSSIQWPGGGTEQLISQFAIADNQVNGFDPVAHCGLETMTEGVIQYYD